MLSAFIASRTLRMVLHIIGCRESIDRNGVLQKVACEIQDILILFFCCSSIAKVDVNSFQQ